MIHENIYVVQFKELFQKEKKSEIYCMFYLKPDNIP